MHYKLQGTVIPDELPDQIEMIYSIVIDTTGRVKDAEIIKSAHRNIDNKICDYSAHASVDARNVSRETDKVQILNAYNF